MHSKVKNVEVCELICFSIEHKVGFIQGFQLQNTSRMSHTHQLYALSRHLTISNTLYKEVQLYPLVNSNLRYSHNALSFFSVIFSQFFQCLLVLKVYDIMFAVIYNLKPTVKLILLFLFYFLQGISRLDRTRCMICCTFDITWFTLVFLDFFQSIFNILILSY